MQETKYFTRFYHSVLLFCFKRCEIKFNTLFDYEINSKRELQNTAINHSVDINYSDYMKIYREYTKESYSFLTIDATLPASDTLRYRKSLLPVYKNDSN